MRFHLPTQRCSPGGGVCEFLHAYKCAAVESCGRMFTVKAGSYILDGPKPAYPWWPYCSMECADGDAHRLLASHAAYNEGIRMDMKPEYLDPGQMLATMPQLDPMTELMDRLGIKSGGHGHA